MCKKYTKNCLVDIPWIIIIRNFIAIIRDIFMHLPSQWTMETKQRLTSIHGCLVPLSNNCPSHAILSKSWSKRFFTYPANLSLLRSSLFSIPSPPSLFYDRLSGPHVSTWWNYTGITYALMVFHHLLQLLIWPEPCNFQPTRIAFKTRCYTDMLSIIFVLLATVVVPIFYLYWSSYFPFIRALKKKRTLCVNAAESKRWNCKFFDDSYSPSRSSSDLIRNQ